MIDDNLVGIIAILTIFLLMPGMVLHYMAKFRAIRSYSDAEERSLMDLAQTAQQPYIKK